MTSHTDGSREAAAKPPVGRRALHGLFSLLRGLLYGLVMLYTFGAILYDGPFGPAGETGNLVAGIAWVGLAGAALVFSRGVFARIGWFGAAVALVMVPWGLLIRPSNDREWKPEFGRTGHTTLEGDRITFVNFRNFDYDDEGKEIVRWEDRVVHLSNLEGMDLFLDAFGGDLLAHPILSFDFGEDGHVCLSIETRREQGEEFSTFGGLYKMFELQYLFGSEEDFIRVRTNVRDEPCYLYRARHGAVHAREILMQSIAAQNALAEKPRFYNVLTANCTTSLRAQRPSEKRERFDYRMLVNGKLDEYLYEKGVLETAGLAFAELRPAALVNPVALEAHRDPRFSDRLREDRPGF